MAKLTKDEHRWCDWINERGRVGAQPDVSTNAESVAAFTAGMAGERFACAELVRAAGCLCLVLFSAEGAGDIEGLSCRAKFAGETILEHDHRCPQALAAAIEARKES